MVGIGALAGLGATTAQTLSTAQQGGAGAKTPFNFQALAPFAGGLAGAGIGALGGYLQYRGVKDQADALRGALQGGINDTRATQADLQAQRGRYHQGLQGLTQDTQGVRATQVSDFGEGRLSDLAAAREDAAAKLQAGREGLQGLIRKRTNFQNQGGALAALAASQAEEARKNAPHTEARALTLGEALADDPRARREMANQLSLANIGRRADYLGEDNALATTRIMPQFDQAQLNLENRMGDAQHEGAFLKSLGSFTGSLGPAASGGLSTYLTNLSRANGTYVDPSIEEA